MLRKMAATASACARMFSPVSSSSVASSGSAKARARASAWACSGKLSAVAATTGKTGLVVGSGLAVAWLFIKIFGV